MESYVHIEGLDECLMKLQSLRSDNKAGAIMRRHIKSAIKEARKEVYETAKNEVGKNYEHSQGDPRKAASAVLWASYDRNRFGGYIKILNKRKSGRLIADGYTPYTRTLRPGQVGGNRIKRSNDNRNRLSKYYGSDRGFILRFINSGNQENRISRYGNRKKIKAHPWFEKSAIEALEKAAKKIMALFNQDVQNIMN